MLWYILLIIAVLLLPVGYYFDHKRNVEKYAKLVNDNRTIYKGCIHFYCRDCDELFHIKQDICRKIDFPMLFQGNKVFYRVYYGNCPKCGKPCRRERRP